MTNSARRVPGYRNLALSEHIFGNPEIAQLPMAVGKRHYRKLAFHDGLPAAIADPGHAESNRHA
jgi:hypothetical protein